ncbi:MAG: ribonuclease H-like domain-containing protein [Candidatus Riesia sp.]|nr:ribonuclease H-like domain-containing protein [Candidatus Riesia sp.]
MLVTLNADGSFYPETGKAGYAFWVSSNAGVFTSWGKLAEAGSSEEAEMMAVINGLHYVRNHKKLQSITKIIINSDCDLIRTIMEEPEKTLRKTAEKTKRRRWLTKHLIKYTNWYKGKHVACEFRHVKAHKGTGTPRKYVNNWCDRHAKKGAKL